MRALPKRVLIAATAALMMLGGGGYALLLASRDAPPTARLGPGAGAAAGDRPDGAWVVAAGEPGFVGYRVRERLGSISAPNDVVGRSPAVSGTVTIAGGAITGARVDVDITRLRTDVEPRDQRMREDGLETARFPAASFRLTQPVPLGDASGGKVVELRLPGTLTLHGVTRPLVFPVQARWDGATIQVAGSAQVRRDDFGLEVPSLVGYRIEDTGVVGRAVDARRRGPAAVHRHHRSQRGPVLGRRRRSGLRRVGSDDALQLEPTWSPDGRRIAYVKDGAIHIIMWTAADPQAGDRLRGGHRAAGGRAAAAGCSRPARPDRSSWPSARSRKDCDPTRGEASQGTGAVAAAAPSRAQLGPGVELERTAETVAAGRGGRRLLVSGTVYAAAGCATPLAGASLKVWQTNADGEYGPGQDTGDDRCCYLAAALRTDARGHYQLETVMPGHYKGEQRPPPAHIHFEVRHPNAAGLLTELLFAGDPWLGQDPPGEIVQPTELAGADPPALQARFDIVLQPR